MEAVRDLALDFSVCTVASNSATLCLDLLDLHLQ
jgi:hypothetical protein